MNCHCATLILIRVAALAAATLFIPPSWVSDLGPIPDVVEYAVTAQRLVPLDSPGKVLHVEVSWLEFRRDATFSEG